MNPVRVRYESEPTRTRAGVVVPCCMCGEEIVVVKREAKRETHVCSEECKIDRDKVEKTCPTCGEKFYISPSRAKNRTGFNFCSRECKDKGQSRMGNVEYSSSVYGECANGYRWFTRDMCVSCGETQNHRLVTHHKDGDRTNNDRDNLECVCRNCHADRHLKHGVFDTKYLTPREELNFMDQTFKAEG